jgi:hypothetical protein
MGIKYTLGGTHRLAQVRHGRVELEGHRAGKRDTKPAQKQQITHATVRWRVTDTTNQRKRSKIRSGSRKVLLRSLLGNATVRIDRGRAAVAQEGGPQQRWDTVCRVTTREAHDRRDGLACCTQPDCVMSLAQIYFSGTRVRTYVRTTRYSMTSTGTRVRTRVPRAREY